LASTPLGLTTVVGITGGVAGIGGTGSAGVGCSAAVPGVVVSTGCEPFAAGASSASAAAAVASSAAKRSSEAARQTIDMVKNLAVRSMCGFHCTRRRRGRR
jgi:hypothetical protein